MKLPHITEYLQPSETLALYKLANQAPQEPTKRTPVEMRHDWKAKAKIMGQGLAGMTIGTLAGFGGMELADRLLGGGGADSGKQGIPFPVLNKLVPILGAGMGIGYTLWKQRELERLQNAVKPSTDNPPPSE